MSASDLLISLSPLLIAVVIIYFGMIRPQKRREQEVTQMREGIKVGDHVLTVGGIKGQVISAGLNYMTIQTSQDTTIEFTRSAIFKVLSEEELEDQPAKTNDTTKA